MPETNSGIFELIFSFDRKNGSSRCDRSARVQIQTDVRKDDRTTDTSRTYDSGHTHRRVRICLEIDSLQ